MVALRGNREPGLRYLLATINVVPYPGSHRVDVRLYCTGVIPVEACGIAPPPNSFFFFLQWRPGLRLGLCALYARGRSSRGIYHSSTLDGGDVF